LTLLIDIQYLELINQCVINFW